MKIRSGCDCAERVTLKQTMNSTANLRVMLEQNIIYSFQCQARLGTALGHATIEAVNESGIAGETACAWSFYILSSGGGDELAGIGVKAKFCE
jgi:hypothetical protein